MDYVYCTLAEDYFALYIAISVLKIIENIKVVIGLKMFLVQDWPPFTQHIVSQWNRLKRDFKLFFHYVFVPPPLETLPDIWCYS